MFRSKRLPIMIKRKQNIGPQQILQGHVSRITLFRQNQSKPRLRLNHHQFHHLGEKHALPVVIQTAPPRNTMKIRSNFRRRQPAKLLPTQTPRHIHQPRNLEIPLRLIEVWHLPRMQHRPLQCQRLPRRQPPLRLGLLLQLPPLIPKHIAPRPLPTSASSALSVVKTLPTSDFFFLSLSLSLSLSLFPNSVPLCLCGQSFFLCFFPSFLLSFFFFLTSLPPYFTSSFPDFLSQPRFHLLMPDNSSLLHHHPPT
jgi:hypothetical protein